MQASERVSPMVSRLRPSLTLALKALVEARRARLAGPQRSPTGRKPMSEFAHYDRF